MRRFQGALVAVLLLAALTQAQAPAQRSLDDLLRQRADAVLARDEAAFVAGIDPEASPAFVADQRQLFRNLIALPLRSWSYSRDGDQVSYALDVDAQPVVKDTGYQFVSRHNRWYLSADRPVLPWDFGPLRVRSSPAGVVLSHPGDEAMADRVLAELEPAVRAVTEVWGTDWDQRVVVVVPRSPDELRGLVGPVLADFAGIAVAEQADPPVGQRVVINPARAGALGQVELGILLRHEITHVAARRVKTALWLMEGFADYVGFRGFGLKQAAPLLTSQVTAVPTDFVGPSRDLAYQQALSICRYLAASRGEQGLVAYYRSGQSDVDVAAWRAYLVSQIG